MWFYFEISVYPTMTGIMVVQCQIFIITIKLKGTWFILWHICSEQELWSQRNNHCYLLPACNNRGIITIWAWNKWVNTFPQKGIHATIGELCFLYDPCWGVMKMAKKIVLVSWVSRCQPAGIWAMEQRSWIEELRHQNYWVQFSEVESLTVRRRLYVCYNTVIFGVCNSLRLL
jgi:hypothetical protein